MNILVTQNPNKDKSIKETTGLNKLRTLLDKTQFFKEFVSKHGFELNPHHFKWEYHINFNNRKGFMVLTEDSENPDNIMLFLYPKGDEVLTKPTAVCYSPGLGQKQYNTYFTKSYQQVVKSLYREFIQPNK